MERLDKLFGSQWNVRVETYNHRPEHSLPMILLKVPVTVWCLEIHRLWTSGNCDLILSSFIVQKNEVIYFAVRKEEKIRRNNFSTFDFYVYCPAFLIMSSTNTKMRTQFLHSNFHINFIHNSLFNLNNKTEDRLIALTHYAWMKETLFGCLLFFFQLTVVTETN